MDSEKYAEALADEHVPEDIHPRSLIIAIQQNLGITKKEISERTGISYGTLNRYTRRSEDIGRPRQSSMQRLINLYRISLKRYGTAPDRDDAASRHPGADYRRSLIGSAPSPLADVDLRGFDAHAVTRFLNKVLFYAKHDVEQFRASGLRDRTGLESARDLLGDAYTSLVHDVVARDFAAPQSKPDAGAKSDSEATAPAAPDADEVARGDDEPAEPPHPSMSGRRFDTSGEAGA